MKAIKCFALLLLFATGAAPYSSLSAFSQSETHNFVTYDTVINVSTGPWSAADKWNVRISRPVNMFVAGNADTASRPAIVTMPGQGELGVNDISKLLVYGPHYWLNNGWDGSVVLGNGAHYPILITVCYTNNVWPTAPSYYNLLSYLLSTYHIKKGSVYLGGLSQGSFTAGALIEYEATAGDETGMKIIKAMALFEGTPDPLPAPYSTWSRGNTAFAVWAQKYGGRFFTLEGNGSDNFRNSYVQANAMDSAVPGSAYFSYENLGGGAHCCWNSMYDPSATNWNCVGTLGPNNAASQVGKNTMGDYHAPSGVFQWMLRQGDSSLVGSGVAPTPPPVLPPTVPATSPTIPARIEAESYNAMSGVQTQATTDIGGGLNVGWIDQGDWMNYNLYAATARTYTVSFRVATPNTGTAFQLKAADGTVLAALSLPATGGFQVWQTLTATVTLPAGNQTLQILSTGIPEWNINWMQFDTIPALVTGSPIAGNSIPGIIQAESYDTMFGVQTQSCSDSGGGLNVGWIYQGDWMDYNVNVAAAGTYAVSFRISTPNSGGSLQLTQGNGAALATLSVPNTGSWLNWQTISSTVSLQAGNQKLRIYSRAVPQWNINWMQFSTLTTGAAASPTTLSATGNSLISASSSIPVFMLYPNPVKDQVELEMNNIYMGNLLVQVTDLKGAVLKNYSFIKDQQEKQLTLELAGLATGVYFIRVQIGDWNETKKLLKL